MPKKLMKVFFAFTENVSNGPIEENHGPVKNVSQIF